MTWEADNPDLTPCFQQTVLVWVPCVFLWFFSFLEVYYIKQSRDRDIPYNSVNLSKLIITAAIIILTIVDLVYAISVQDNGKVFAVHFYTPVIKISTFVSYLSILNNAVLTSLCFICRSSQEC